MDVWCTSGNFQGIPNVPRIPTSPSRNDAQGDEVLLCEFLGDLLEPSWGSLGVLLVAWWGPGWGPFWGHLGALVGSFGRL
eukprot:3088727-Pyramimonas_sp.AAC.1